MNNLDYVILDGYDYNTPVRNPKEADYASPLYELLERNPELNINFLVTWWLKNGFPNRKLILSMPTFGRAWKLDSDSALSGVPPLHTDGVAPEGNIFNTTIVVIKKFYVNNSQQVHTQNMKVF